MPECLACRTAFAPFLSLGRQPIANGFLAPEQFPDEPFFELTVGLCPACKMVQLGSLVEPAAMFHANYAFFASTSAHMVEHFRRLSEWLGPYLGPDPLVVEIGSNDGILLQNFARRGVRHLGVEPSANVAAAARAKGVQTVVRFFDEALAGEVVAEHGPADVLTGTNVLCHIPDLHGVLRGALRLLKPDGVLVWEDPYLPDILAKTAYDQIYDEHAFYFCATSLANLLARHGMELVDLLPQPVHGGSMRYVAARRGARPVRPSVAEHLRREAEAGVGELGTYEAFRRRVEASRERLVALLRRCRADGKRVVGYGATSKSTTVANYCGLTPDLVEFISDTTPSKQGKFSPGAHIPVRPHAAFAARPPDYALLFAWNHAAEILAKERSFVEGGGRFITYVPEVGLTP